MIRGRVRGWWPVAVVAFVVALATPHAASAAGTEVETTGQTDAEPPDIAGGADGALLYARHCSSCHGPQGEGIEDRAPTLVSEGEAAVDFVLRTGRMPMAEPAIEARRGPVRFDDAEIVALVAYVGAWGDGPAIPTLDPATADLVDGGELYRLNCAACHVASGSGAIIGSGRWAPNLMQATRVEVAEAVVVGPGAMPVFGQFTEDDINDVAAYVMALQHEDTTGVESLGGIGPVAEGLAAWFLVIVPLISFTRWIGRGHRSVLAEHAASVETTREVES